MSLCGNATGPWLKYSDHKPIESDSTEYLVRLINGHKTTLSGKNHRHLKSYWEKMVVEFAEIYNA